MITGVHHITLLVRDLEEAMNRYRRQLGIAEFVEASLPERGVRTARFTAGDTHIVLIEPVAEGEPMRQLNERGEGLFLLSFEVDDLGRAIEQVEAGGGGMKGAARRGLEDWDVIDVDPAGLCGSQIQLTQRAEK
jgi:methylmalonyl-CoA/ethylmalonyl-CoA epimerase